MCMYYFVICRPLHRRAKGEVEPEHGDNKKDDQGALPPRGSGWIKAWILCELMVLGYMPILGGRPLLIVVVAREGLVFSRGHDGG